MIEFLLTMMMGLGLTIAIFGIGAALIWLVEKFKTASRERNKRVERLIAAIERIEQKLTKPDHL
jgi:hypothetical protein